MAGDAGRRRAGRDAPTGQPDRATLVAGLSRAPPGSRRGHTALCALSPRKAPLLPTIGTSRRPQRRQATIRMLRVDVVSRTPGGAVKPTPPSEKAVEAWVIDLFKKAGCHAWKTSQPRATMITEGLPDLWVFCPR